MVTPEDFRKIALAFPDASEQPHHDVISYRIQNKIFATIRISELRATVLLTPDEQSVFCYPPGDIIYPVPNKWGNYGWTHLNLALINKRLVKEALKAAYKNRLKKKSG